MPEQHPSDLRKRVFEFVCGDADWRPKNAYVPSLEEAGELTAMLTAGMKRLRPVALRLS